MRLDRKLNLVVPVETDRGVIYVHHVPISRDLFERYFLVIAKTFAQIFQQGLNVVAGPRIAALMLKEVAETTMVAPGLSAWDGDDGVARGLVAEIRRLTNVAVPSERGWQTLPYDNASRDGTLTPDDVAEVEGLLTFFTLASVMMREDQKEGILAGMRSLWGPETTSSNCTDYASSLPTSTAPATSNETPTTSPEPSSGTSPAPGSETTLDALLARTASP